MIDEMRALVEAVGETLDKDFGFWSAPEQAERRRKLYPAWDAANRALCAAPERSEEMREALVKCRDKFREYERHHRTQADRLRKPGHVQPAREPQALHRDEKAERNREMAELCDKALANPRSDGDTK